MRLISAVSGVQIPAPPPIISSSKVIAPALVIPSSANASANPLNLIEDVYSPHSNALCAFQLADYLYFLYLNPNL